MDKESLLHTIRDRLTVAKYIVCSKENENKSFADGYFKGWLDATLIILNAIDRTDILEPAEGERSVIEISKQQEDKAGIISETEADDLLQKIKTLFRSF